MQNSRVVEALKRTPKDRTGEDINYIFHYLRQMDVFQSMNDGALHATCQTARLERHPKDHCLFRRGQSATCWYILLSGSVLMNNKVYLPSGCFGKRSGLNLLRRNSDCLVIQASDMIVIDYQDVQRIPVHYQQGSNSSSSNSNTLTRSSVQSSQGQQVPLPTVSAYQPQRQLHSHLNYYSQEQFGGGRQSNFPINKAQQQPQHYIHTTSSFSADQQNGYVRTARVYSSCAPTDPISQDYSDSTLTASSGWKYPSKKRVPSPAPRSASISITHTTAPPRPEKPSTNNYENTTDLDLWTLNRMKNGVDAYQPYNGTQKFSGPGTNQRLANSSTSIACSGSSQSIQDMPKRNSLHESQLNQQSLLDSIDSGIQLNAANAQNFNSAGSLSTNFSSSSSSVPPPAPVASKMNYSSGTGTTTTTANDDNDHFLAPSAQRINKMRNQMQRKNSDDSTFSGGPGVKIRNASGTHSLLNATARRLRARSTASSSTTDGDEFAGLPETAVDSDEDDEESIPSHDYSFVELKDNVRECLEKEPMQRTSDDIHVLMEFMQQMPALASLPLSIKRQLCLKMVFAVVPEAGTIILHHGEKIDSWSVLVNGAVEHVRDLERIAEYRLGDAFGAEPIPKPQYMDGEMRTLVDDCEFVLVEHEAYCSIMSTLNQHIEKENDTLTGEVVREAERRVIGSQIALVIIKAKPDRLIHHLIEELDSSMDDNFVQDFLLMYRVFIFDPTEIMCKVMSWFDDGRYRERVARIVLIWVNNHFNDFESNKEMLKLLEQFELNLEKTAMYNQQSLLNITCSIKSRPRSVTLTRSNRDQELAFSVVGGNVHQPTAPAFDGIFVSTVEPGSPAEKNGLKRGDEIMEVNGQPFRTIPLNKALDVLRESTHLSLLLKSNMMGFKEMLSKQEQGGTGTMGRFQKKSPLAVHGRRMTTNPLPENHGTKTPITTPSYANPSIVHSNNKTSTMFGKIKSVFKNTNGMQEIDLATDSSDEIRPSALRASRSNPDIASHIVHQQNNTLQSAQQHRNSVHIVEQAVKVYRSDQTFRFLTVVPHTTAKNIVDMAIQEFGMNESNNNNEFSLCECICSVANGDQKGDKKIVIKQRRLPDDLTNLAERVGLASRLYLRNNQKSETLIPDELAGDVLKEAKANLYTLNAQFVAMQLTMQDFDVFSAIEPTEYVDNLFQLESRYGWAILTTFEDMFNKEMWWVVTEICLERSVAKRVKLVKKFIKIARHCRDLRNFNSMFAIVSGLEKPSVRRLAHTWERIPGKYLKMLNDLQQFMDPSRNMSKYRQHLNSVSSNPPVMPIYPILKKDLTFAHESKPTFCGALINFEKLRMIARIIRSVTLLCSVKYDLEYLNGQNGLSEMSGTNTVRKFASGSGTIKSLGNLSRKKLYEQTLMRRKVKTYLLEMPVIDVEQELDQLSMACEPNQLANSITSFGHSSVPPTRRRPPSPSPSSLSSHSNQSADQKNRLLQHSKFAADQLRMKFSGVDSPQAIQKMLSLVQNSKVKAPQMGSPRPFGAQSPQLNKDQIRKIDRIPSFAATAHEVKKEDAES